MRLHGGDLDGMSPRRPRRVAIERENALVGCPVASTKRRDQWGDHERLPAAGLRFRKGWNTRTLPIERSLIRTRGRRGGILTRRLMPGPGPPRTRGGGGDAAAALCRTSVCSGRAAARSRVPTRIPMALREFSRGVRTANMLGAEEGSHRRRGSCCAAGGPDITFAGRPGQTIAERHARAGTRMS